MGEKKISFSPRMCSKLEGFCLLWDVPGTDMEAADAVSVVTKYLRTLFEFGPDAAHSLTVLHNCTNMVRVFGNSITENSEGRPAPAVSLMESRLEASSVPLASIKARHSWWYLPLHHYNTSTSHALICPFSLPPSSGSGCSRTSTDYLEICYCLCLIFQWTTTCFWRKFSMLLPIGTMTSMLTGSRSRTGHCCAVSG